MAHLLGGLALTLAVALPCAADGPPLSKHALAQVLEAARERADAGSDARHQALSRRARLSGLVPRLRLRLRRGTGYDLYRDLAYQANGSRSAEDEQLVLEASATFELDRLAFAPEQVRITRQQRVARADADERVREVLALVFRFEKLWLERRTAATGDPALDLEIAELRALLDVLTGETFSQIWRTQRRPARSRGAEDPEVPSGRRLSVAPLSGSRD